MRSTVIVLMSLLALAVTFPGPVTAAGAQAPGSADLAKFDGTWKGTFAGDSTGTVIVRLKTTGDKPTGTLTATFSEGGGYDATFKTLTLEGATFKAAYDAPGDGASVSLEATLSGETLKGTWNAGSSSGTWTATRQPADRP